VRPAAGVGILHRQIRGYSLSDRPGAWGQRFSIAAGELSRLILVYPSRPTAFRSLRSHASSQRYINGLCNFDSDQRGNANQHAHRQPYEHNRPNRDSDNHAYFDRHSDNSTHSYQHIGSDGYSHTHTIAYQSTTLGESRDRAHQLITTMTSPKRLLWILLVPSFILGCVQSSLVGAIPANIERAEAQATVALATIPADATPTPTPFLPLPPTPTYIPTEFPTPAPTATPQPEVESQPVSSGDTSPAQPINYPQDQINILLLGSDQRVGEIGFRTDTIVLLSINTRNQTASMVSFPRDLYVYIPGYTYNRINTVMYYGGFPLMAQTLQNQFGVRVDHYLLVGLDAFIETIDSLGGINVHVGETLRDQRTGYGYYTVKAGEVMMSGADALWYVRSRYTTSDFDRTRRQQEVIQAIGDRLLSMNALESADELYDIYYRNVTTDMKWVDIAPMVPLAAQIGDPDDIQRYAIGRGHVIPWTTPGGAQVLLPQEGAIRALLQQAVGSP